MKKVGIVTFHYADNYGAVLQTWALYKVINSFGDCKAEVVNFIPKKMWYKPYSNTEEAYEKIMEKRKFFYDFLTDKLGVEGPILDKVEDESFDYFVVGSDQVWNFSFGFNQDYEYLLPNVSSGVHKVSYAASIGLSAEAAKKYDEVYRRYLKDFEFVSLRESEQLDYINEITDNKCCCVVDPTLLLDKDDYEELVDENPGCDEPYIFLFWIHDHDIFKGIELANTISRKYNLKVVHSLKSVKKYTFANEAEYMFYSSPGQFLSYIKHADFVITNSYHASIFSIHFEKPFYSFVIPSMRSRFVELSEAYDIGDRIVDGYLPYDKVNTKVDFANVKEKIKNKREQSMMYLKKALGE